MILSGTRRVGKTTIQYQMIENLLNSGISPQKILFISMDHPMLKLSSISDILECYHENIYADQDVYYFFDEVQYAADWDKWLKTIYDMQPDTHVVATGSASPVLMKGNRESGAGRWTVIQVPTLSFYEYCELLDNFRGGKKNKEIGIVVEYPNTNNILIEVKYREGAPIADDDAIAELCEHSSAAIIVTKNADDFGVHNTKNGHDMVRIPAFAFLYLLGHAEKHGYQGID